MIKSNGQEGEVLDESFLRIIRLHFLNWEINASYLQFYNTDTAMNYKFSLKFPFNRGFWEADGSNRSRAF